MEKVIFIPTASVYQNKPSSWLKDRLESAIDYYQKNTEDVIYFVVSGRWCNVTDSYEMTESEVAKNYLLSNGINPKIILKEDIAVETGGNFAFSKPIIASLDPQTVVIINSEVNKERTMFFTNKIFGPAWNYKFIFLSDEFSKNERAQRKEPKALAMFKSLFEHISDGDDEGARNVLLYKTPFYYKNMIDDETFFNQYWPGGFQDFTEKRLSIDNK